MHRRSFLTVAGTGATLSIAGCTSLFEASLPDELEDVEPDADQLPVPTIASGPVSIDVYEDLGCPACHDFQADVFPDLEARLLETGEATYRHYDFPVSADDQSVAMATAARAVQAETMTEDEPAGEFFAYKQAVIAADDWSDDALADLAASETDVDRDAVADALSDGTYYPTLVADWNRGDENGVEGTPTVIVDGEQIEDPFEIDEIVSSVEDAR
ncbi:DsbA family protein [Natronorubrum bangense]|uniref:Protein-disulfide isomerase n=2 Tax=Natronorubrum bangense TaxID=61858 RepID=L9WT97_9EURY|nr:thioredoxin domain-containing protein [Natronorubrum bangense]ELY52699.1 protein-disulfide isomerase [Natronorubrum bangense JCM 10635]QCC55153.1 disulfide bond formation protein DsbA [Natronorubrum bangense]